MQNINSGTTPSQSQGMLPINSERTNINDMKRELMGFVRPLLSLNTRVCGLSMSGNNRGQLQFVVIADYDCSQRQQLLADLELFLQNNIPERLRTEFKLNIRYISLSKLCRQAFLMASGMSGILGKLYQIALYQLVCNAGFRKAADANGAHHAPDRPSLVKLHLQMSLSKILTNMKLKKHRGA
nr:hypothetical protein [Salinisphaera sp. G21_0]